MTSCSLASETQVFKLAHLKPREIIRTLEQSLSSADPRPTFTPKGQDEIVMHGGDAASQKKAADLVKQIDQPHITVPTKFVPMRQADAREAADFISRVFASSPCAGPAVASRGESTHQ